jgi:pyruvate, water dikinase
MLRWYLLLLGFSFYLNANAQAVYSTAVKDIATFDKLKGEPLNTIYSGIQTIKLCYTIADKKLYFINSKAYKFHLDFCNNYFKQDYELGYFNKVNYSDVPEREYILATLNYYTQQNIYTIEFVSEDDVSVKPLKEMYTILKDSFTLSKSLPILVNNLYLLQKTNELQFAPLIYPEDIYKQQTYQALVYGKTIGKAKKINNFKADFNEVKPSDIIFFDGTPLTLPLCKAVVTNAYQTPLSHINILCNNRKTPACVLINYDSILTAKKLWNKWILININKEGVSITEAKEPIASKTKAKRKIVISSDILTKQLITINENTNITKKTIGSKAYGVVQLCKIAKQNESLFKTPSHALAIPFYYYDQHIKKPAIAKIYKQLAAIPIQYKDSIEKKLKQLRKIIKTTPIDTDLLNAVTLHVVDNAPNQSWRFRSSSNAEDLEGFNGAGLYSSTSAKLLDSNKTIAEAIAKIWASVWNYEAWQERSLFGIDQNSVKMAILVHVGFPDEDANGVAITKHLYRNDFPAFTINVQVGEVSVVAPPEGVSCDQIILISSSNFIAEPGDVYEQYITRSSINNGKNVLNNTQIKKLYQALDVIKSYIYYRTPNAYKKYTLDNYGLDIEFKFIGEQLYIKQVRPYN